jgi:hypothetical protein
MGLSRKTLLGCGALGIGLPLLGVGGGFIWVLKTFGESSSHLEEERALARKEGVPLLPEDLRPKLLVPASQNAAPLIREALALWPEQARKKDEKVLEPLLKPGFTEAQRSEAEPVLKKLAPMLALAREAAQKEDCDFQYDYAQGFKLEFPELPLLRALARLLSVSAALAPTPEEAFSEVRLMAQLGNHVGETPVLVAGLVGVAVHGMAHKQFCQALIRFGAAGLPEARKALSSWGALKPFGHFLASECMLYHLTTQRLLDGKLTVKELTGELSVSGQNPVQMQSIPPVIGPIVVRSWATHGLVYWRGAYRILRETESDPARMHTAFQEYSECWAKTPVYENILLRILTPVFSEAAEKLYVRTEAERRLRESALAVMESGGKIVSLPADPFARDNVPLKLRRDGKETLIWSIGPDRTDDNGLERDKERKIKDLVVRVPA